MSRFVTVTPNPAVDRLLTVAAFSVREVNRAEIVAVAAGGKGVNAARALNSLGADVCAVGFAGGPEGAELVAALAEERIVAEFIDVSPQRTRFATVIIERSSAAQTVINEQGPDVGLGHWAKLEQAVAERAEAGGFVLLCGSLPPGAPGASYAPLIAAAHAAGAKTLIDCTAAALVDALTAGPTVLKINRRELAEIGCEFADWNIGAARVVEQIGVRYGLAAVAVTDGGAGALGWAHAEGTYMARVPSVEVVSAVGSGDSFAAGFALALQREPRNMPAALRLACACGAANAMNAGAGALSTRQVESVSGRIDIVKVA